MSLAHVAFGQTAAISGAVKDQTGGAISGVQITATQTATAQKRSTTTDKNGNYVISLLPIGDYQVAAAQSGFKTDVRTVELRVGDRSTVEFNLAIGNVAEQINVTGEVPLIQAESSSTGAVVENKRIEEVPLNGRQFQNLALLVPGTTDPAQGSSLGFRGGINVAGTRTEMTGFTLDGVDIVENLVKALSFKPSVDMIQEFKVDTSTYSAEYGRTAGGQVRATTKSGTNELHGTLFEFVRNSAFDAKNFFDSPTAPIPGFRRNNFGATAGGPIVKNRTFIFGAYEGLISRQAQTRTAAVPTAQQLSGNFAGSKTVVDPLTGVAFPGNVIPASLISPVSANIIQQYPAPNIPGSSVRNYVSSPTDIHNIHQFTSRVDHRISDQDSLFGRYSFNNDFELDPFDVFSGITNLPSYGRDDYQRAQSATVSDTHIFDPSLVGQLSLGYNRFKQIRTNVSHDNYPSIWGIQGTTTNLNEESGGVPAFLVTGYDSLGKSNLPSDRVDTTYQLIGSLTYIHGSHTIKFGGDGNSYSTMRLNNGGGLGSYTFSGQYSGNSVADLLLGYPSKASRSLGDTRNPMFNRAYAAYVQDDWKITKTLTLNLGLRYDLETPLVSADDRLVTFDPATGTILLAGNPSIRRDIGSLINPASPAYNSSLAQLAKNIPIQNLGTRNTYTFSKHDFAPRLGLAYRLFGSDKLVLRAGYGIFYNELLGQYGQTGWNTFPYFISQTFNGNPTVPNLNIANPFATASAAATISPAAIMEHWKSGYVQSYNFGIQASPFRNVVVDIGYAGSVSTHLPSTMNLNQPAPSPTGSVASRRPYPQFGNIGYLDSSASANFNSFQLLVEKRYSRGLELAASYTWSKSLDTVGDGAGDVSSPPYAFNVRGTMYGPSSFDERQRLVLSYVYELPFGAGSKYLGGTRGVAGWFVGGWELSGIGTFDSGRPFTVVVSKDQSNTGGSSIDRPVLVGDPLQVPGGQTVDHWFNTAAYALAAFGTEGNVGRNTLVGPRFDDIDFSLLKNTSLGENRNLQFRAEIFNILNHPNFDLPNHTIDSAQAGGIFSAEASRQIQLALKFVF
ncbi:MAG TPA: TonB-dependent receptor [Bryobacteraceae bacterium]|nr:TonB-dependent receptor [Bryobacteraceae bacterium]